MPPVGVPVTPYAIAWPITTLAAAKGSVTSQVSVRRMFRSCLKVAAPEHVLRSDQPRSLACYPRSLARTSSLTQCWLGRERSRVLPEELGTHELTHTVLARS